jgi:predicted methyltransferase
MQYIKSTIQNLFKKFGSPIVKLNDNINDKKSQFTTTAFIQTVFWDTYDHMMYQNVLDAVDNSSRAGERFSDGIGDAEFKFIINEIKPGDRVIDIGANIGFYTLILAKLVGPYGEVYAFEPDPISHSLLKVKAIINEYKKFMSKTKPYPISMV